MLPTNSALLWRLATTLTLTLTLIHITGAFPSGAPPFTCKRMRPNHPWTPQSEKTFPVNVKLEPERALPGAVIDVHVSVKNSSDRFQGLLVTARPGDAVDTVLPGFILTNTTHFRLLNCTSSRAPGSGLTHRRRLATDRTSFKWRVPDDASIGSTYILRTTVVRRVTTYWVGVDTSFTVGQPRVPAERATAGHTDRLLSSSGQQQQQQQQGLSAETGQQQARPSPGSGQPTLPSSTNEQQTAPPSPSGQQQTQGSRDGGAPTGVQKPRPAPSPTRVAGSRPRVETPAWGIPSDADPPASRTSTGSQGGGSPSRRPARPITSQTASRQAGSAGRSRLDGPGQAGGVPAPRRVVTPLVDRQTSPQHNLVTGGQIPAVPQRTNTLPEGQGREGRGTASSLGGVETRSGSGSRSGSGMSAWLSGWFGR
ncbi:uncharacterized protein LOC143294857 isoform X1 [Babylonia areolata]|uniref:uncharacterized protein LOC143294857 isoform X1 n=1 Tax=Babylonia areolata TaxID=304850 RepID=UPI003FD4F719